MVCLSHIDGYCDSSDAGCDFGSSEKIQPDNRAERNIATIPTGRTKLPMVRRAGSCFKTCVWPGTGQMQGVERLGNINLDGSGIGKTVIAQ